MIDINLPVAHRNFACLPDMDNDISSDFFAITLAMAGQRPTHFPGMLPPFELSDDPAIQTMVTPPTGPITQTQEMFSQNPALWAVQHPYPQLQEVFHGNYEGTTRSYFSYGHPVQFHDSDAPTRTSSPSVAPSVGLYTSRPLHIKDIKETDDTCADSDDDFFPPETIH